MWLLTILGLVCAVGFFLKKGSGPYVMNRGYHMKDMAAPSAHGTMLKFMCFISETPPFSWIFLPYVFIINKFGLLRTARLDAEPTLWPVLTPQDLEDIADKDNAKAQPHVEEYKESLSEKEDAVPLFSSVSSYARAYRRASSPLSPVTVAQKIIDTIRAADQEQPPLRAFIDILNVDVLVQARESEERFRAGKPLSILDGVPVAVKDEVDQLNYQTTVGTKFLGEYHGVAKRDAEAVARLRAQGAILIGKTNMHEIGMSTLGFNPHHGTPRNPYNVNHYTGGSSAGSACAVAAGFCPLALGADGGGSIRVPASLCGVVGLKPTLARISERGAFPLCWSVAHLGPIGSCVQDVAIGYAAMAGRDAHFKAGMLQPDVVLPDLDTIVKSRGGQSLSGIRIGIYDEWFQHADSDVVQACMRSVRSLEALGATIEKIEIPYLEEARLAHVMSIISEMSANMEMYRRHHINDMGLDVRVSLAAARTLTSIDYIQANRMRTVMMNELRSIFKNVDVIATPTNAITAPAIPEGSLETGQSNVTSVGKLMRFVSLANLTGNPAISVPVGYQGDLPIGLQFMGRWWEEALLLKVAALVERGVERRLPQRHYKIL
eukprot:TRINITY_DN7517_c0_g1_i5.p1 TRINITY_DN7517_c0_g1~~TRINITY_DN7517_c0_g1_i5.p1  ORF type:complete len:616 (-),score=160.59 TRINITY_DN7517_c0_g1_i5:216-2027(-)